MLKSRIHPVWMDLSIPDPTVTLARTEGGGGKMDGRLELCHKEVKSDGTTCRAKQWDHGLPAGMLRS